MKTKLRSLLRCVSLEERLAPDAGGSDPISYMLGSQQYRGLAYQAIYPYVFGPVQPQDGKILYLGAFGPGAGSPTLPADPGISRYLPDGSIDQEFGTDGRTIVPFFNDPLQNTTPDGFTAAIVLPDRKILVAGVAGPASITDGSRPLLIVRLLENGQLDATFGTSGRVIIQPTGGTFTPNDLVVRPDGTLAFVGSQNQQAAVLKLDSTLQLDSSFANQGIYLSSFASEASGGSDPRIENQPSSNRLIFSLGYGSSSNATSPTQLTVIALTSSGQLDSAFGNGGIAQSAFSKTTIGTHLFVRADGAITLAGTTSGFGNLADLKLARFTKNGLLDSNFGTNGMAAILLPGQVGEPSLSSHFYTFGLVEGTADSLLLYTHGGPTINEFYIESGYNHVTRIQSFGQVDLSFGPNGSKPITIQVGVPLNAELPQLLSSPNATDFLASGPLHLSQVIVDEPSQLTPAGTINFLPHSKVSVRTVTADVNGDGVPDLIGGSGPGGGPHVIVIDGKTKFRMAEFFAFEQSYTGGINITAGDLNGDGKAEIVVTPDRGGGPIVAVYDGAKLADGFNNDAQISRFFGIEDKNFRGGARVAVGDVSGDGTADLLVSAGFEGGPRIALFDGTGIAPGTTPPPKLIPDFFAFEPSLRNGAYVTLGDLNGDGQAELVFGGGPGGSPRVRAFDGKGLLAAGPFKSLDEIPDAQLANFFAADANRRGGIRLAIKEINGSPALLAVSGENEAAQLRVFPAATLLGSANPQPSQVLDLFDGAVLADGVFVG
jgi:uncharacterized delta-60 repeat protein